MSCVANSLWSFIILGTLPLHLWLCLPQCLEQRKNLYLKNQIPVWFQIKTIIKKTPNNSPKQKSNSKMKLMLSWPGHSRSAYTFPAATLSCASQPLPLLCTEALPFLYQLTRQPLLSFCSFGHRVPRTQGTYQWLPQGYCSFLHCSLLHSSNILILHLPLLVKSTQF